MDKTLRLWDGQSGVLLATLAGHTSYVNGAQVHPDGRLLSCSQDGTLRLWNGQSGEPIGEPISESDLPWVEPSLLFHRNGSRSPTGNCRQTTRWSLANTGGIATCAGPIAPACWHGNSSRVAARDLLREGILVVTLESGHVFCLQLYRGTRRITIQDYEKPEQAQ